MAGFRCQTLGIGKTELHHISPPIVIDPFLEDPQLCPVYHMVRLNKILDRVRPKDVTDFWLSSRKPHKPVSTQTLCKWLKKVIVDSGSLSGSARDVRSVESSTVHKLVWTLAEFCKQVTGKECQLSGHIISNLNGWIVFLTY